MTENLHIHLLGEFRLSDGNATLTGVNTPRLQSLLAYLLLHRDASQSRGHVAFQFWPDSTEAQARSNLRTLLHRLRRALPDPDRFLHVDAQTVQWRAGAPFDLDVAEVEADLARAETAGLTGDETGEREALVQAVAGYQGDLLPSCYDDWLLPERERLLQAYLRALERLIELLEGQRAYDEAIRYAQRLLRHDPLHEAAYRRLMRLRALQGDRAGALREYHACASTLQRELGVEPGPATQRAYEDLLQAESRPAPIPTAPGVSPLVGREEEWAQLQTVWRRAARGPRIALLLGEAGIGKTRLVEEMLDWARRQGIAHAYARCYAAEGELAYAPVTALLQSRPLPELGDVWLAEIARLLPEVLDERPDLEPRPMAEAWQRQRFFQALARAVLGGSDAPKPLLLVVEDLQWCDSETLDWLHYLLRFRPRAQLLVIGSCRPEELDADCALAAALPALHRDVRLAQIELGPLDEIQTASLAGNVARQALDPSVLNRLFRETEGNPLFVVETIRAGLPAADAQAGSDGERLPPRVQAVLETRLAQLTPAARDLAGLAATVGRSFTVRVLERAGNGDGDILVQGLDELWQRRIVRERGLDAYDFAHDKLRDAAYNTLSPARRRLLHQQVGQALESVYASEPDSVARRVAAHYDRAGLPERAIPRYLRAGETANRIFAHNEAAASFRRGLELLEQRPIDSPLMDWRQEMVAGLYEGLGDALRLGSPSEAQQAYQLAVKAADDGDPLTHARLQRLISSALSGQGRFDEALQANERAAECLGEEPFEPIHEWREEWLAERYSRSYPLYALAKWRELEEALEPAENFVNRRGTAMDRLRHYGGQGIIYVRRDRFVISDTIMAQLQVCLDATREIGDPSLTMEQLFYRGWFLVLRGDLDEAEPPLRECLALGQEIEYPLYSTWALTWLGCLFRRRNQVGEARRYAERGLEAASRTGITEQKAMNQASLAWAAWRRGDLAETERRGMAAVELWQSGQWVIAFHWAARLPLLDVAVQRGKLAEAVEHAAAMLHPQQMKLPDRLEAALQAGVQAGEAQQMAEAEDHLQRAVNIAKEMRFL